MQTQTNLMPGLRTQPGLVIACAQLPLFELQGSNHLVSYVNAAFCGLTGKTSGELLGNSFAQIVRDDNECVLMLDRLFQNDQAAINEQSNGPEVNPARWLYAMWPALRATEPPVGVVIQMTNATNFHRGAAAINEALLIAALNQHELTGTGERLNERLQSEITERKLAEAALQEAKNLLVIQAEGLEREVAERTATLRETVGELESFSYSIAHDLRAPLRGMRGFAQILLEEQAPRLDAEAQGHLGRIVSCASRMDSLIMEVLDYTRVSRGDASLAPVDLDGLVRDILASYPDYQSPKADIQVNGTLPFVLANEGFLTQCVSNLLSNAIKFVAPGITPEVRIWAEDHRTLLPKAGSPSGKDEKYAKNPACGVPIVRVWFKNNGIGIAPKDHERVFGMFECVNPTEKFEGAGIGLTIVRKAVERMGGEVGFDSELNKGSCFWIDLKKG